MIDKTTARDIVSRCLSSLAEHDENDPWVIWDEYTEEYDIAWVFYWTKESIFLGKARNLITGNNPILVDKQTGFLFLIEVSAPPKFSVEKYRKDKNSLPRLTF